jgi:phosphate starvation-inducible protein PhoH
MTNALADIEGIAVAKLEVSDIVRNPIIGKIIGRLDNYEKDETSK